MNTAQTHAHRPLQVLVVDDDPDFAESLAELLRYRGHEVRIAGSGLDAVAACVERPFDVIFLDVRLPGLTGYDLARWVRGRGSERHAHLIAVTGSGSDADRQRAAEIGIDQFELKPLDPARLDELLARAVR
jgi:CheY-like chemotaxis protein